MEVVAAPVIPDPLALMTREMRMTAAVMTGGILPPAMLLRSIAPMLALLRLVTAALVLFRAVLAAVVGGLISPAMMALRLVMTLATASRISAPAAVVPAAGMMAVRAPGAMAAGAVTATMPAGKGTAAFLMRLRAFAAMSLGVRRKQRHDGKRQRRGKAQKNFRSHHSHPRYRKHEIARMKTRVAVSGSIYFAKIGQNSEPSPPFFICGAPSCAAGAARPALETNAGFAYDCDDAMKCRKKNGRKTP
jgi:hypothetical protein